jgi:MazG family protein
MHAKDPAQAMLDLLDVMKALRAPDGCPWDAQQTPQSLAPYILEEAAELVDAIETGDVDAIRDEAGDLLLQVVFIAQIFDEGDHFDFADVAESIASKLIRRHPHVFSECDRSLSDSELDHQWESIKRQEKKNPDETIHPLGQIPGKLPALQRAQKLLDRAHKNGIDLPPTHALQNKLPRQPTENMLGEALFSLVKQTREAGFDAEQILRQHVRKLLDKMDFFSTTNDNRTSVTTVIKPCSSGQD